MAFALMAVLSWSCVHVGVHGVLSDVENYVDDRPDSALVTLQALNINEIDYDRDKALYSLLYSKALDKSYIDVASDSLIYPAYEFYQRKGSAEHRMQMWYYYGRVQFNATEYAYAAISYMKAAELAEKLNDNFMAGLACRGLSETHKLNFNYTEALQYMNKAYEYFYKSDKKQHADYALFAIANTYMQTSDYRTADSLYSIVYDNALKCREVNLQRLVLEDYIYKYSSQNEPNYDSVISCAEYINDSLHIALSPYAQEEYIIALVNRGRIQEGLKLHAAFDGQTDPLVSYYNNYKIHKAIGDSDKSISFLEQAFMENNKLCQSIVRQSVSSVQRDYFQSEYKYQLYKRRVTSVLWILSVVFLALLLVCLCRYYVKRNRSKQEKIDTLLIQIEDLAKEIKDSSTICNEFSNKIQQLYETKFKFIDAIGQKYYSYQGATRDKYILREVHDMIALLADDKELESLEIIVNAYKDNVIILLRQEFPKLKPKDIQFMCYWYAGFSPNTMSLLLDEKIENIYNRKSRMRRRLDESASTYRVLFLEHLP